MTKDGKQTISVVPKQALVVVSSTSRNHLEANPDATYIKISDESVLPSSALAQLK
jgi:hypothetical protein